MAAVISLVAISLMFVGQSSARIDPATCVGVWLFDKGSGNTAFDSSENGNDGTIMGNPGWVDGKFNSKALSFDGTDDYVQIPDSPSFTTPTGLTVAVWIKPENVTNIKGFVNKHVAGVTNGTWTLRDNPDGGPGVALYVYGAATTELNDLYLNGVKKTNPAPGTLKVGEWIHLAGVWKGTGLPDTTHVVGIGYMENAAPSWLFNGIIDEVAIFNVALEEEDIQATMTQGLERAIGLDTAVYPTGKLATTWATIKAR